MDKKISSHGVPVSKINNIQEALNLPQVLNRNMVVDVNFNNKTKIKVAGNPIKFSNYKEKVIEKRHQC